MAGVRTAIMLCLMLILPLLPGCGRRGTGYDAAAVTHDLGEMLRQASDFQPLYDRYRRTADFGGFLRELEARLQGSAIMTREPPEVLSAALGLIRQHHLGRIMIADPLLLMRYHVDPLIVLLALEEAGRDAEIEGFFAGLHELTVRASSADGAKPEVVEGLARALRSLRLRQPFLGASPPYAAETYGDRLGEIPASVELALQLLEGGWKIAGFYEEGRAKITRIQFLNFTHLQAVIDLVATEGAMTIFLQVEQALDGTDRDLKQIADRVEATADYLQEGDSPADFSLPPGSKGVVALIVKEGATDKLWQEIKQRAGLLRRPIPILMVYGEGEFKMLNLTVTEARGLVQALGYSPSS